MRFVKKALEPRSFISWKQQKCQDWSAEFGTLQNPEKADLLSALILEQEGTCCYCGIRITATSSHIEHFRPQASYPHLATVYENLFASCIRATNRTIPVHCGHLKGCWFDEGSHLSPIDDECEKQFFYTLDGQVSFLTEPARTMRNVLGLGIPFLCNRREETLKGIFDLDFLESATPVELEALKNSLRNCDEDGILPEFSHVIVRYIEQLLSQTQSLGSSS